MPKTIIPQTKKLYRSESDRMLGGVAAGIAQYFSLDPSIIRIFFVLFTVMGGSGIIAYMILWVVLPTESKAAKNSDETIKHNTAEIKEKAEAFAGSMQETRSKSFWGFFLVCLGVLFLLRNFGILEWVRFDKFWPLIPVAAGIIILMR
jgi:phage shock protein PspC (stress-responsive transcriptional regulator)